MVLDLPKLQNGGAPAGRPRPSHLYAPGLFHLLVVGGNNGQAVFLTPPDWTLVSLPFGPPASVLPFLFFPISALDLLCCSRSGRCQPNGVCRSGKVGKC